MKVFLKIKKYARVTRSGAYVIACAIGYFLNKYFPEESNKNILDDKQTDSIYGEHNIVGDITSSHFMSSNRNRYL